MRFANSQANDVLTNESITLAGGTADVVATAWDGEGWLACDVKRVQPSAYIIHLNFKLRQLEQEWPVPPAAPITVTWHL